MTFGRILSLVLIVQPVLSFAQVNLSPRPSAAVGTTQDPVFSPPGSTFNGPAPLTITDATPGAVIHYLVNVDKSPATASSPVYVSPFLLVPPDGVSANIYVSAVAIAPGLAPSNVITETYYYAPSHGEAYYSDFTSTVGLSLNGTAKANGTRLQLTNGTGQAGSAFTNYSVNYRVEPRASLNGFETQFTFQLSNAAADGFTFVLQNSSPQALGANGGNLGLFGAFAGTQRAIAISFGLYAPSTNQINAFYTTNNQVTRLGAPMDLGSIGMDLHSGHVFSARIYNYGALTNIQLIDTVTGQTAVQVYGNLPTPNVFDKDKTLGPGAYYAGFTGGTGGLEATQEILSWTYVNLYPAGHQYMEAPPLISLQGSYPAPQQMTVTNDYNIAPGAPTPFFTVDGTTVNSNSPYLNYPQSTTVFGNTFVKAAELVSGTLTGYSTSTIQVAPAVDFTSGFTPTSTTLNRSASLVGSHLRLTNGGLFQSSSAFYPVPLDPSNFNTDFDFQLTNASADGFMFVLQSQSPYAVGNGGGDLGFGGLGPDSLGIKFDLFSNAGEGLSSSGLYVGGAHPTVPAFNLLPFGIDLRNGHLFHVHITGTSISIVVQITDTVTGAMAIQPFPIDATTPIIGKKLAYFGFTAGTGGLTAVQDILDWSIGIGPTSIPASPAPQTKKLLGQPIRVKGGVPLSAVAR